MKDPKTSKAFYKAKYSEEQIRSFIKNNNKDLDYYFWWDISRHQDLSEDFIREFKDKVDWWGISEHQKLSEAFLREFKDKIDWELISAYQTLSEAFLIEFIKDIELGDESHWGLIDNKKIPEEVKKRVVAYATIRSL